MANNQSYQFNQFSVPPEWKKYKPYLRKILLGLILVIFLWMSFFQVEPEEIGVITRFGKYVREVEPGLNFKIPILEKVYWVPVERQQKQESEESDERGNFQKRKEPAEYPRNLAFDFKPLQGHGRMVHVVSRERLMKKGRGYR